MRKIIFCVTFIVLLMLCVACQPVDKPTLGELNQTETIELTSEQSATEESESAAKETDGPTESDHQPTSYDYYIDELDVMLTIPAELYAYRINGVYQDWTDELNVHDFSEWIVVTDREFDESTLADELRDNYEELAKHVIWGISLVSKELWPVQQMCQGLFSHQDYRIAEEMYCRFLYTENTDLREGWLGSGLPRIIGETEVKQRKTQWDAWRNDWKEEICEKTLAAPYVLGFGVPLYSNDLLEEDTYRYTIANDDVWDIYQKAVEELTTNAHKYQYDEAVVKPFVETVEASARNISNTSFAAEGPGSAYIDAEQDVWLRAYAYAHNMVGKGKTGLDPIDEESLRNVVIVRLDWEKGQKSHVTYVDAESDYYIKFSGFDYSVDLIEAYRYVQEQTEQAESSLAVDETESLLTMPEQLIVNVNLTPYPDEFIIYVETGIRQENGDYILSGRKLYGGDIVIDYNKKALLDAGAKVLFCLEGQEMFSIDSVVKREDYNSVCYYQDVEKYGDTGSAIVIIPFTDSRMDTVEPKAGEFKVTQPSMGRFSLVLEENFELVVPADTLVYPHHTYNWEHMRVNGFENGLSLEEIVPVTMAEFCETVIDPVRCSGHYLIYMEDGVIVKIVEEFSW